MKISLIKMISKLSDEELAILTYAIEEFDYDAVAFKSDVVDRTLELEKALDKEYEKRKLNVNNFRR